MVLARAAHPHLARQGAVEERKKVLRICVNKLQTIQDPEAFLCRSVLINNTLRQIQEEHREGQRRARLKRMRQVVEEEEENEEEEEEHNQGNEAKAKRYRPENIRSPAGLVSSENAEVEEGEDSNNFYDVSIYDEGGMEEREEEDVEVCGDDLEEDIFGQFVPEEKPVIGSIEISVVSSALNVEDRLTGRDTSVGDRLTDTVMQFSSDENSSSSEGSEEEEEEEKEKEEEQEEEEDTYHCPYVSVLGNLQKCENLPPVSSGLRTDVNTGCVM